MAANTVDTPHNLITEFQTAMVNRATSQAAQSQAADSESSLLQHLGQASNGNYLQPANLAGNDDGSAISHASLDAHIKKVQASQLHDLTNQQLAQSQQRVQQTYKHARLTVRVTAGSQNPIDCLWFDQQHGYRTSTCKKQVVSGIIEDILLDRNLLVLRPSLTSRLLTSNLQSYIVYVIDPATGLPMVSLDD